MKKVLSSLKYYIKETILAPLFKMLEATFELFVPLVMADIIDVGIASGDKPYIYRKVMILVALGIIGLVCSLTAQFFAAKAATGAGGRIRERLYSHTQKLSFQSLDRVGTSTLITRMTADCNQVQNGINMVLRLLLRSPFIVFGAMIMAFTVDVKGALTFVVIIPLLSIVVFGIMAATIPLYRKVQEALDRVLASTRENLGGVRVIRAFHKEESEKEAFEGRIENLTKLQLLVGRISGLMNPLTYVLINLATVVLIYISAGRVYEGSLSRGCLVALVNYMSQILVELIKLANLIVLSTKTIASIKRIEAVLDVPAEERPVSAQASENAAKRETIVTFQDVSLCYQEGADEAVSDVNFTAKEGETIGIIGGTGSGKTSLVNLIANFYPASRGKVLINGEDVNTLDNSFLRKMIGIVPQKAVLFKGSIRDNLCLGLNGEVSDEEIWEALEQAQAADFVRDKKGELDFVIEQGGKNLSGGQRQRLTIARALVRKPKILILDDSASALDYATDAALRKAIRALPRRPLTFIVSQRTASMLNADRIIVLEDGDVAGIGTHESLLDSCEVYKEIYHSQFGGKEAAHA